MGWGGGKPDYLNPTSTPWILSKFYLCYTSLHNAVCELTFLYFYLLRTVYVVNPFISPKSVKHLISPYNITR